MTAPVDPTPYALPTDLVTAEDVLAWLLGWRSNATDRELIAAVDWVHAYAVQDLRNAHDLAPELAYLALRARLERERRPRRLPRQDVFRVREAHSCGHATPDPAHVRLCRVCVLRLPIRERELPVSKASYDRGSRAISRATDACMPVAIARAERSAEATERKQLLSRIEGLEEELGRARRALESLRCTLTSERSERAKEEASHQAARRMLAEAVFRPRRVLARTMFERSR